MLKVAETFKRKPPPPVEATRERSKMNSIKLLDSGAPAKRQRFASSDQETGYADVLKATNMAYFEMPLPESSKRQNVASQPSAKPSLGKRGLVNVRARGRARGRVKMPDEQRRQSSDFWETVSEVETADAYKSSATSVNQSASSSTSRDVSRQWQESREKVGVRMTGEQQEKPNKQRCDECKLFGCGDEFRQHVASHGRQPYTCPLCPRTFTDQEKHVEHLLTFMHSRTHELSREARQRLFDENVTRGTACGEYTCNHCGLTITANNKQRMLSHLWAHGIDASNLTFKCTLCPLVSRKTQFKHHMIYHSGERPFKCQVCSCTFVRYVHLTRHMITHDDSKPFACTLCDQRFKHEKYLGQHLDAHMNIKRYSCDVCHLKFTRDDALRKHIRTQHLERRFACGFCGRTFVVERKLHEHVRTHTGETPHPCPACDKRFATRKNMLKHVTAVHRNEDVRTQPECGVCGEVFIRVKQLAQHCALMHDGKTSDVMDSYHDDVEDNQSY